MNRWVVLLLVLPVLLAAGCGQPSAPAVGSGDTFTFGVILPGTYNDRGWGAAHYEAGQYVEQSMPGTRMVYIDNVNPGARPGVTVPQVVDLLAAQGARLIIAASEEFCDGVIEAAQAHPDLYFISVGSDIAWREGKAYRAPANVSNLFGRMVYGKMIGGYAAGMTTQTGKIGYVGPLVNAESRRLAAATYLGARDAWVNERHQDPARLQFIVSWIGFWFNIPGQTLDPSKVSDEFFATGCDVVVSGINTTEALVEAGRLRRAGHNVYAVPYDYHDAGREAADASLGVPYFNWGPSYAAAVAMAREQRWQQSFSWPAPYWPDINDRTRSSVGFTRGEALSPAANAALDRFIAGLGDGSSNLFRGPLNYQDGSVFLRDGEIATDQQIWYLPQLLQGMTGASAQ